MPALVWLGIVGTAFLRKYRRHAIVAIFVLAAVVTPSTDPFNHALLAAPLLALYEVGILVGARVEKRRDRAAAAVWLALLALWPERRGAPLSPASELAHFQKTCGRSGVVAGVPACRTHASGAGRHGGLPLRQTRLYYFL